MGQEKSVLTAKYNERPSSQRLPTHQSQSNSSSVQYSQVVKRSTLYSNNSYHQQRPKEHQIDTSCLLANRKSTTSIASCLTERSVQTNATSSSEKSTKQQTKYLNEHLYIKSYLDIEEEKVRNRRVLNEKTRSGLRNYTPKILTLNSSNDKREVDVWI